MVLGGADVDKIAAALLKRVQTDHGIATSSLVLEDIMEEGILDPFDVKRFKETQKDAAASRAMEVRMKDYVKGSLTLGDAAPSASTSSKAKGVVATVATAVAPKKKMADKDYLPQIKGCSIQKVTFKHCYTCYYPGVVPGSRTRTYGELFSESACKRAVIRWAWNHHTRITKEKCPHDLSKLF